VPKLLGSLTTNDNSQKGVTSSWVTTFLTGYAPLASPALSGVPTAPTASVGTNTSQLATTAFVLANAGTANAWKFTGNAGTDPATHFLGTTDNQPLMFRINNSIQMQLTALGQLKLAYPTASGITGTERLIINDATGSLSDFSFVAAGGGYPALNLGSSRGTPVVRATLTSGDSLGSYLWWGFDGSSFIKAAEIVARASTVASGVMTARVDYIVNGTTVAAMTSSGVALSGLPTAPTASVGTSTTQLATTEFVSAALTASGVAIPAGEIPYGNASGTGLTSSSMVWDSISGLSVGGSASFAGNGVFGANLSALNANLSGSLLLTSIPDPAIPSGVIGKLYSKVIAGRVLPKWVGPSGIDFTFQPLLGQDKVSQWSPPGNATTAPTLFGGASVFTVVGTATKRDVTTTNKATRTKRLGYVSNTSSGSLTSIRTSRAQHTLGVPGNPNMGGFFLVLRFVPSNAAYISNERFFAGLWATTGAPTNVEPSTLTNCIGLAKLSGSSNLHIVYGGSVAQPAIDLGATFPATGLSTDLYELIIFAPPNLDNTVYYKVARLNVSQAHAEGTLVAATPGNQLPLNTTRLAAPVIWKCNHTSNGAVAFDLVSAYLATDE